MNDRQLLGKQIRIARKDKGFTSDKLSELCNINATYLRQIEAGTKMPSLPIFIALCKALDVSADFLLKDILNSSELFKLKELDDLFQKATPSQQKLILSVLRAALDALPPTQN